jgi:hypothetical protein
MSIFPALLLLTAASPAPIEGTLADADGRPVSGVEIVLTQGQRRDGTVPILGRATTDAQGHFQLSLPALSERTQSDVYPTLFAYRPGSALTGWSTVQPVGVEPTRLVLQPAGHRTITVKGEGGKPLAGVRLAPYSIGGTSASPPDRLADRLEVTTGADGKAELGFLGPTTAWLSLRVTIPGVAAQVVTLPRAQVRAGVLTLDLKPGGRAAGCVMREDREPAAGVVVELWSSNDIGPPAPVKFDGGPVRTAEDGTFRTPSGLLAGVKYRAVISEKGFKPLLTEWITAGEGADSVAELKVPALTRLGTVAGRVVDRKGQPVAGAKVVAGGEEAAVVTDEEGKFRLEGLGLDITFLIVRADGFRISGRRLNAPDGEVKVTLARFDEPARPLNTLPSPIPIEERRQLARRVLDPVLEKALDKGTDNAKHEALNALLTFDPRSALEALDRAFPGDDRRQNAIRFQIVRELASRDHEAALAVAEGIPLANMRTRALLIVALALGDNRRAETRAILERALASVGAEANPTMKVNSLGMAADLLLRLGDIEGAKALFAEARAIAEKMEDRASQPMIFLAGRLARVDLPGALALIGGPDRFAEQPARLRARIGEIAVRCAPTEPAEAEKLLEKVRGSDYDDNVTLRVCRFMAAADLPRAERIALAQDEGPLRARALIFIAYGLPSSERTADRGLVRRAIDELDRNGGPRSRPYDPILAFYNTPAALMPIVESVDPALVSELFWRSLIELAPISDPRVGPGFNESMRLVPLLARYDRDLAAVLLDLSAKTTPAAGQARGEVYANAVDVLAMIDPRRAVAIVEASPVQKNVEADPADSRRCTLAEALGRESGEQWQRLWQVYSGLSRALDRPTD